MSVSARHSDVVLVGAQVVTPAAVLEHGWVRVSAGRIADVGTGDLPPDVARQDLNGALLLPGYVDLHMHGGGGHNVTASLDAMAAAVAFHHEHGTTSTLVSLVSAPVAVLVEQLRWAADLTRGGGPAGSHVLGAHLEGPFLSHARCGAQNAAHLIEPDPAIFAILAEAAGGTLRCVTIAPELDGALALVGDIVATGAVAALGHSDATYLQACAAIAAGASLATHLFNGMRPLHHREPGLIGAALATGLACELINDGVHVHPSVTRLIAEQIERLVLITDAIDATGVGDGEFELGGQRVQVLDGEARLVTTGSLAGSTLTMDAAVRRAVQCSGLPITAASIAASGNPARVLGVDTKLGAIAPGLSADLVLLDDDLTVLQVMADGSWNRALSRLDN